MTEQHTLAIGLIGSGYMGRAHAIAFRSASAVFDLPIQPRLSMLADVDGPTAQRAAEQLGFERSTGDWHQLVGDPDIDLVDITTPNRLHVEIAMAAIGAGKHLYCEKPLAPTAAEAGRLMRAAEAAGVKTMVGFSYLKNPITVLAKEIVDSGEIGEVFSFRGNHFEDYMLDPNTLVSAWRLDARSGDGVVADLGTRVLAGPAHRDFARFVPAPGHQLGFNDLKAIEVRDLIAGIAAVDGAPWPDFREAWEVQRVIDALIESDRSRAWASVAEIDADVEAGS